MLLPLPALGAAMFWDVFIRMERAEDLSAFYPVILLTAIASIVLILVAAVGKRMFPRNARSSWYESGKGRAALIAGALLPLAWPLADWALSATVGDMQPLKASAFTTAVAPWLLLPGVLAALHRMSGAIASTSRALSLTFALVFSVWPVAAFYSAPAVPSSTYAVSTDGEAVAFLSDPLKSQGSRWGLNLIKSLGNPSKAIDGRPSNGWEWGEPAQMTWLGETVVAYEVEGSLWQYDILTEDAQQLDATAVISSLAYSPASNQLAWWRQDVSTAPELMVKDLPEGEPRVIVRYPDYILQHEAPLLWSPDGKRLAFPVETNTEAGAAILVLDGRTGEVTHRFEDFQELRLLGWSTDSQSLYMTVAEGNAIEQAFNDGELPVKLARGRLRTQNIKPLRALPGELIGIGTSHAMFRAEETYYEVSFEDGRVRDQVLHEPEIDRLAYADGDSELIALANTRRLTWQSVNGGQFGAALVMGRVEGAQRTLTLKGWNLTDQ